jgi:hypothetical protein
MTTLAYYDDLLLKLKNLAPDEDAEALVHLAGLARDELTAQPIPYLYTTHRPAAHALQQYVINMSDGEVKDVFLNSEEFDCTKCSWPYEEQAPCDSELKLQPTCKTFLRCVVCHKDPPFTKPVNDALKAWVRSLRVCEACKKVTCNACYSLMIQYRFDQTIPEPGCAHCRGGRMMTFAETKEFIKKKWVDETGAEYDEVSADLFGDERFPGALPEQFQMPTSIREIGDAARQLMPAWADWTLDRNDVKQIVAVAAAAGLAVAGMYGLDEHNRRAFFEENPHMQDPHVGWQGQEDHRWRPG